MPLTVEAGKSQGSSLYYAVYICLKFPQNKKLRKMSALMGININEV